MSPSFNFERKTLLKNKIEIEQFVHIKRFITKRFSFEKKTILLQNNLKFFQSISSQRKLPFRKSLIARYDSILSTRKISLH
jgi:hypothetical protein